jgi:hypothetical protein
MKAHQPRTKSDAEALYFYAHRLSRPKMAQLMNEDHDSQKNDDPEHRPKKSQFYAFLKSAHLRGLTLNRRANRLVALKI